MRSRAIRPDRAELGAESGYMKGDGRTAEVGDLWVSQLHEQLLSSLEVSDDGADVGVDLPDALSPVTGLAILLRKSV